ncbi:porin family protein [Chitinophaga arvensicola]|uniref:Outer membrane protein beta-barrel domain-containing protein n=1 Tax=Chitinophaga arvensicola TaxID=29529 RepID=A0A1I0RSL4_9BACT|nr:porin family protein [Chitinophaga arvensicola]SEW44352.1 Outer membrane protein beta-barrel domain-containing protein [Chitinophaga arvensicola]
MNARYFIFPALTVLLLATVTLHAQDKPFSFVINAGFNISNASETISYLMGEKKSKPGFQAGVLADYQLGHSFYLESGLSFTTKGSIRKGSDVWIGSTNPAVTYWKKTIRQSYLQLPLLIGYRVPVSAATRLFINAGPYVAVGIAGKEVSRNHTVHQTAAIPDNKSSTATFSDTGTGLDRLDYGLSGGVGAEYRKFRVGVNYEMGLVNIGALKDGTVSTRDYKNRNLSFTVGYRL